MLPSCSAGSARSARQPSLAACSPPSIRQAAAAGSALPSHHCGLTETARVIAYLAAESAGALLVFEPELARHERGRVEGTNAKLVTAVY
jgi:hypothetical protein